MAFDAFEVTTDRVKFSTDSLMTEEDQLNNNIKEKTGQIQKALDGMDKKMAEDLGGKDMMLARIAMERELDKAMPDDLSKSYETYINSDHGIEGFADFTLSEVLTTVNDTIQAKLGDVIKHIDDAEYFDIANAESVRAAFDKIGPISHKDMERVIAAWKGDLGALNTRVNTAMVQGSRYDRDQQRIKEGNI